MRRISEAFLIFVVLMAGAIWWLGDDGSDEAYAEAQEIIAAAVLAKPAVLHLDKLPNLKTLPPDIATLDRLVMLNLKGTKISDIDALGRLDRLQILNLRGTRVTDLEALSGMQNLEILDVGKTWVSDLSPLVELASLKRLDVGDTQLRSLEPTTRMAALDWINLHGAYAIDGSRAHFETLHSTGIQVNNGRAFRENYQPDWIYRSKVRFQRVRARLGL